MIKKNRTEEFYIKTGILIFKMALFGFIIIFVCLHLDIDNKLNIFKIIYWIDLILNLILGIIAFNMITKFSGDNKYDFFERFKINSIHFKAKIWIFVYFLIVFLNISFLCALSEI